MFILGRRDDQRRVLNRKTGGTRLRVVPMLATGFVALAWMISQVSSGALAVNFNTTNQEFKVYSNYIQGVEGASYLARTTKQNGANVGASEFGFKIAKLSGFCAVTNETLPIIGQPISLVITAGVPVRPTFDNTAVPTTDGGGNAIELDSEGRLSGASLASAVDVTDLYFTSTGLVGYGNKIKGLNLNQNASTVGASALLDFPTDNGGQAGVNGNFGMYSHYLNVANLDGQSFGINLAGSISLPKLRIKVLGTGNQASCTSVANG